MEPILIFNPKSFRIIFKGVEYKLGKTKYLLLDYLYKNCNRPVTIDELIKSVWSAEKIKMNGHYFISRSMEVHMVTIKKIINSIEYRIENIHGFGKMMIADGIEIEFARKQCVVDNSDYEYGSKTITLKTTEAPPKHLVIPVKEFINIIHKKLIENESEKV